MAQNLTDDAAVREDGHSLIRVRGADPLHPLAYARSKKLRWFGSRDDVPALFRPHQLGERMPLDDPLAEQSAFPFAEMDLAQP